MKKAVAVVAIMFVSLGAIASTAAASSRLTMKAVSRTARRYEAKANRIPLHDSTVNSCHVENRSFATCLVRTAIPQQSSIQAGIVWRVNVRLINHHAKVTFDNPISGWVILS